MSLLEGGGRQLFILVAEIRGRAAFISADLQIHEGGGGSRRGAGGPEKLTINFTRPNIIIFQILFAFSESQVVTELSRIKRGSKGDLISTINEPGIIQ